MRLISVFMCICLSLSMLAGCSSEPAGDYHAASTGSVPVKTIEARDADDSSESQNSAGNTESESSSTANANVGATVTTENLPSYSGTPYVTVNNNVPYFTTANLTTTSYEQYSQLDSLGRCGPAMASIGIDLMPTGERESIGMVKPTGWQTVKYDCVDGGYLYNRCHLIGYQLSGENANERNLITGTRYMNVTGMLPFENMVADYVQETDNHVLYRVTPIFNGSNLVASGVLMEAESVEDKGDSILFCVYCYNVQPGITINYANGDSSQDGSFQTQSTTSNSDTNAAYVLNTNSMKFHLPTCSSAADIKDSNRQDYTGSRADLIQQGYSPCKRCNP